MFRRFLRDSNKGFTLIELLVASLAGLLLVGLCLSATVSNRRLYQYDLVRTRLNQNLRSAMDVMGTNVREAGENLAGTFPAIEFINGTGEDADQLIVRRNLIDEVLKVCEQLDAGSTTPTVKFSIAGTTPGCIYSDQLHNYTTWQNYRIGEGGSVRAYIYDQVAGVGEFFDYTSETDSDPEYAIIRGDGGDWDNTYQVGSAAVYMVEEWHFQVDTWTYEDNVLQVIANDQDSEPLNIAFGILDFQVEAVMQDDSVQDELGVGDSWVDLQTVRITLSGQDQLFNKTPITREITTQFFPRNILSN